MSNNPNKIVHPSLVSNYYMRWPCIIGLIEIEPDNGNYLHTYGLGLYKQGNLIEAQEVLKTAWDLIPYYDHDYFLHIQEVELALARQSP